MRRSGGGLGFGFRFRLGVRLGFRLRLGGLGIFLGVGGLLATAFEIGGVPAGAFQLEARRAQLLAVFGLAAHRTDRQHVRHLLQVLIVMAAGVATVFVNRHGTRLYR